MELILLRRQYRLSQEKAVPIVLKSMLTPEEFLLSASRYETLYKAGIRKTSIRTYFVLGAISLNWFPMLWSWSSLLVDPNGPSGDVLQSLAWIAMVQLSLIIPKTACFLSELYATRRDKSMKTVYPIAYFLDPFTIVAVGWLTGLLIFGNTLQSIVNTANKEPIVSAFANSIPALILLTSVPLNWLSESLHCALQHNCGAMFASSSSACLTSSRSPKENLHELLQLTPEETEAIQLQKQGERVATWKPFVLLIFNVVFTTAFVRLFNRNPSFLHAFGFNPEHQEFPVISATSIVVIGSVLSTLLIRPLIVTTILELNFWSRRNVLSQDVYV